MPKKEITKNAETKKVTKKSKLELALKAFSILSPEEKETFLKTTIPIENSYMLVDSAAIVAFGIEHQRLYSENIRFTKAQVKHQGPMNMSTVSVRLITAFGNFNGSGSNQKEAKAQAVSLALKEMT